MNAGEVLVALLPGIRMVPLLLPEDPVLPLATYQTISTTDTHMMSIDGHVQAVTMQIDAWATAYAEAHGLADTIHDTIHRHRGVVGTTMVHDVLRQNRFDLYEDDVVLRRVMQEYTFYLSEV